MRLTTLLPLLQPSSRRTQESRGRRDKARRKAAPLQRFFVPGLEALEPRTVPSILTVLNDHDSGLGSLRAAIAAAGGGDTIRFAERLEGSTITLTTGPLAITKSLNIKGLGADELTISGNHASRIFDVSGSVIVNLSGLTVAYGLAQVAGEDEATGGGGIVVQSGATLHVSYVAFRHNQALGSSGGRFGFAFGGGLDNDAGTVTVSHCTFADNQAIGGTDAVLGTSFGGGIYNAEGGTLTVTESRFIGNRSLGGPVANGVSLFNQGNGGAIDNDAGTVIISHSTFTGNQAIGGAGAARLPDPASFGGFGGAILNFDAMSVTHSRFADNQAIGGAGGSGGPGSSGIGGGIAAQPDSTLDLTDSWFSHNAALGGAGGSGAPGGEGRGGALDDVAAMTVTVTNTTFTANQALGGAGGSGASGGDGVGGGISDQRGTVSVTGCTLERNQASGGAGGEGGNGGNGFGGGIAIGPGGTLEVTASTITRNRAVGGEGDDGGSDGQGIGGGVYNLGTFTRDVASVIRHNHASTSNDDIFP